MYMIQYGVCRLCEQPNNVQFMSHLTNDKILSPHPSEVPERCQVQERDCETREEAECGQ